MLDSTIGAAVANGARMLLPCTVYNYGTDAGETVDERAPQNPLTSKGRIRVEMERRLHAVAGRGRRRSWCAPGTSTARAAATARCRTGWCRRQPR